MMGFRDSGAQEASGWSIGRAMPTNGNEPRFMDRTGVDALEAAVLKTRQLRL